MFRLLLVHDEAAATPDQVRYFLNARSEIDDWISVVPFVYFLVSSISAYQLSTAFMEYKRKNGNPVSKQDSGGRFSFLELGSTHAGWLNQAIWDSLAKTYPVSSLYSSAFLEYLGQLPSGEEQGN